MSILAKKIGIVKSIINSLPASHPAFSKSSESSGAKNKSILMIDDDTFLLNMYSNRLRNEGYDVTAVASADEAYSLLQSGSYFDLMLVDIIMPGMSGTEFLHKLREENLAKDTLKVVLSNMSDQTEISEKGEFLGVQKYIVKAEATPSDVVGAVNRILD